MGDIPGGTVTFLFTDIEGSTMLAQKNPEKYSAALKRHHEILNQIISDNKGFVFEIIGDAFCTAFSNSFEAVNAAYEIQLKLKSENWDGIPIKIRIGIHSGNAEWNGTTYSGYITLARTNRIMSAAYGEQVIVSAESYELAKEHFSEEYSFRDLGERRMKDLIQPMRLFQLVSPNLRDDFPNLKTLDARPNNLPIQLTSFVGREDEIKKIKEILRQTHLLTLTGSGGSGKTRLALQVSAELIDEFENGVWYVELASLLDSVLLPQTISQAIGVKEDPKRTMEETLCDYLRDKELMLILDNCEHMIEECARLTELMLSKSPKLRVIATSREALRCSGEMTHRIMSLDVPDAKTKITPEKLSKYTSVKLFTERALAVNPKFTITESNATALAQICYQLDGIPLAIELAAARINVLSVEKINERLVNRFKLLTGGRRTALPRQQTLKALIDWSYDLLSDVEKTLWNRLSVFSGGWTLESAEIICSDDLINEEDLIELLDNLTEKSVIVYNEDQERYRMLETMRQYGEEKLTETGRINFVSDNHLNYFTELAEASEDRLHSPEMKDCIAKLNDENGNFENALHWSVKSGDFEKGLRLAGALGVYWQIRGNYSEGRHWYESLINKTGKQKNSAYAKVLNLAGSFMITQGEHITAQKLIWESLEISREIGDKNCMAEALNNLGKIGLIKGEIDSAKECLDESLNIFRDTNNKHGEADTVNVLGRVALRKGDNELAQKLFTESLEILIKTGDQTGIANEYNNLATAAYYKGENDLALELYEKSLAIARETGDMRNIGNLLNNIGSIAGYQKQFDKALSHYEESLNIRKEIGDKNGIASSLHNLGLVSYQKGDLKAADNYYKESIQLFRELLNKEGLSQSLSFSGLIAEENNDFENAEKLFDESISIKKSSGDETEISFYLNHAGYTALNLGNYEKAKMCFRESLLLSKKSDNSEEMYLSILGIGSILISEKNFRNAALLIGFSENLREEDIDSANKILKNLHDKSIALLKDNLENEESEKFIAEGRVLKPEQAEAIALAE